MEKTAYIYALVDPYTNEIRYVGFSTNLEQRAKDHMHEGVGPKSVWIAELQKKWIRPRMMILEETTRKDAHEREKWWIHHLRDQGYDLLNSSKMGYNRKQIDDLRAKRDAELYGDDYRSLEEN